LFATRAGTFLIDRDGYVITYDGKRLQGHDYMLPNDVVGDIQVGVGAPATTSPHAVMTFVSFRPNGEVHTLMTDGTEYLSGIIVLYNFHSPEQLVRAPLGQFSGVLAAQPYAIEDIGQLTRGKTRIEQWRLELVNVPRALLRLRQQLSFFPQGALYRATNQTDLAVDGPGFFLLKHPLTGEKFATRQGDFHLDASGYLVNAQSLRVQGFSDVALNHIGDLRITGRFSIGRDGHINVFYPDGTQTNEGCVLLQMFKEYYQLRPVGHGLYQNLEAAAPIGPVFSGTIGAGGIESSALELPSEPESLSLPDRHGTRMLITGEPGSRWIIQAKDEAKNARSKWRTIGMIPNAAFETEFSDRETNHYRRSYRVLAEFPEP
jgi:flagellar hook protein FlgE